VNNSKETTIQQTLKLKEKNVKRKENEYTTRSTVRCLRISRAVAPSPPPPCINTTTHNHTMANKQTNKQTKSVFVPIVHSFYSHNVVTKVKKGMKSVNKPMKIVLGQ
jgi:hypothetical protein